MKFAELLLIWFWVFWFEFQLCCFTGCQAWEFLSNRISDPIRSKLSLDFKIIHSKSDCGVKTCVKQSLNIPSVTLNSFPCLPGAANGPSVHFCFQHNRIFCYSQDRSIRQGCFQRITKTIWIWRCVWNTQSRLGIGVGGIYGMAKNMKSCQSCRCRCQ